MSPNGDAPAAVVPEEPAAAEHTDAPPPHAPPGGNGVLPPPPAPRPTHDAGAAPNPFGHHPFTADPSGTNGNGHAQFRPSPSGWYPDADDTGGLRFWDGAAWTEHRARLATTSLSPAVVRPNGGPAVCECGVVAVGSCRVCNRPYCRSHISEQPIEDRAFLLRWEAWTCVHCLESDQRRARARQLARCESVAAQIATIPKMSRVRTITGLRPPMVNLFQRSGIAGMRPARHARAHLIEYDGGEPDSTNVGLAISPTGETIYDVGSKVSGVPTARLGPKVTIRGYLIRKEITIEALREASARSTKDSWFEFAARAYLRAGKRLGIAPVEPDV